MKHQMMALLILVLSLTPLSAAEQAEQIMRRHYGLPKPESVQAEMVMVVKDEAGRLSTKRLVIYSRSGADGTSSYTEVLDPADIRGTRFLSFSDKNGAEEQRLWLPELGRIRKISTSSEGDRFLGSDLSYWDMKTHHFEDFSYALQGEATAVCTRNGVKERLDCWVVESVPTGGSSPYGRIVAHIGKEDAFAYRSEMWAPDGSPAKTIVIAEIVRENAVTFPTQTLVISAEGSKTLLKAEKLELNTPLSEELFSLQYLSR
jgi:hypothetical protein